MDRERLGSTIDKMAELLQKQSDMLDRQNRPPPPPPQQNRQYNTNDTGTCNHTLCLQEGHVFCGNQWASSPYNWKNINTPTSDPVKVQRALYHAQQKRAARGLPPMATAMGMMPSMMPQGPPQPPPPATQDTKTAVIVEVPAEITDAIKTQTNNMGTLINAMAEVKTEVKTHTTELADLRSEVKQLKETAITPRRMNSRIEKALAVHSAVVDVRMLGAINKASRRLKDEVETQIIGDDPEKPAPDKNPVKSPATNTRSAISPAKRRLSDPGPAAALKKPSTKK